MKIFAIADTHGFLTETQVALEAAGYDSANPEHLLVGCGDYFDRGPDTIAMMEWLKSIEHKVLVRGNHEWLLLDCIDNNSVSGRDEHNGTLVTLLSLMNYYHTTDLPGIASAMHGWVDPMPYYFETKNYVFTHGWIPNITDWRHASPLEWDRTMWLNGMQQALLGATLDDKTIVCGHYHTSWGHAILENIPEWGERANFDIYRNDGVIALDACTVYSHKVNVLVVEDDLLDS